MNCWKCNLWKKTHYSVSVSLHFFIYKMELFPAHGIDRKIKQDNGESESVPDT